MKTILALLLSCLPLLAANIPPPKPIAREPVFKVQEDYFHADQWNVDLYGTGAFERRHSSDFRTGLGAGVTYFVTRNVGLGFRAESESARHSVFDLALARVTLRVPWSSEFSPYAFAQGGFLFERDDWEAGMGGGLEYKFTKNIGVFGEVGFLSDEKGIGRMLGAAGLRLSF